MATVEDYREFADFLRSYAQAPRATERSKKILALASHFEALAAAAEREQSDNTSRLFGSCTCGL
jgi:hypothetical protein